jgi:penicillin G amidase
MGRKTFLGLIVLSAGITAGQIEVLRDRWGVPHIYASNTEDLFYAQGYFAARDRLFQLDLWRRQNTGHLAEVMGEAAIPRDRIARLVRYRGDWKTEWESYSPDAKTIVSNFVAGINHYIRSLKQRPIEFEVAGYDPGLWTPEDVTGRVAGLLMTHNITSEVSRSLDIRSFGLETVNRLMPPDPFIKIAIPSGLDLSSITRDILSAYTAAIATPRFDNINEQGSNNWVVDGTMTLSGKPMLANDPHRPVLIPSLRKSWHLVAPGWNVIGAGEPALPGIALGHNESIAWGFTIVNIDQQDLYAEKLNPANPDEYTYRGQWRKLEIEHEKLKVKGHAEPVDIELRYTVHGPVLYEDRARNAAYALKWVGAEPGGAGYLAALSLMRAKNWNEFLKGVAHYKVPSENLVYADVQGNIGWIAAGYAPIRKNWSGLLPVPGDEGEYEWGGFLEVADMPQSFNPKQHFIATANHKILPEGYTKQLSFEWALPFRIERIRRALTSRGEWDRIAFERLQQDVLSLPARRFQAILRPWTPPDKYKAVAAELAAWDGQLRVDSHAALIYELWISKLPTALFGKELGARVNVETVLKALEQNPHSPALADSLDAALAGAAAQKWGQIHQVFFRHPLNRKEWNRGPYPRPGDANTINATSGARFAQTSGASYRQIIDVANWDRSVMTNVPGEVGDPLSEHYSDLIEDWLHGQYHPMPFSRRYVEAATTERYVLNRSDR